MKLILILHIATGFTALAAGLVAIVTQKGSGLHRKSGKVFFWSMNAIALTAVVLSLFKNIPFLLAIALFSFYLSFTGYRVLKLKKKKLQPADLAISFTALATVAYMFISQNIVLVAFGVLMLSLLAQDLQRYFKPHKNNWMQMHISRMGGAFIATVTAFVVVNVKMQPEWLPWLLPTIIGSPLLSWSTIKYRKKLKAGSTGKIAAA